MTRPLLALTVALMTVTTTATAEEASKPGAGTAPAAEKKPAKPNMEIVIDCDSLRGTGRLTIVNRSKREINTVSFTCPVKNV